MARTNVRGAAVKVTAASPVRATGKPTTVTHEGAPAWRREERGELHVLGSSLFAGEDTFYEKGSDRRTRWDDLCSRVAIADPAWFASFIRWLRSDGNIRTASQQGAIAAVAARLADPASVKADRERSRTRQRGWNRLILEASCLRADEPAELMATWLAEHGRKMPMPLKRALADLADRLYTEYGLLEYDKPDRPVRMADVIEVSHPRGRPPADLLDRLPADRLEAMTEADREAYVRGAARRLGATYRFAIDRRHDHDEYECDCEEVSPLASLPTIRAYRELITESLKTPEVLLSTDRLRRAGMSWSRALSLAGKRVPKKDLWEALIPLMGYMALIRNLRNFDEAEVSDEAAQLVIAKITDPAQVARCRQFPYRFLAAYREAPSLRWAHALDVALTLSTRNVPALAGETQILVDTSGSMQREMSAKSKMRFVDTATLFGLTLLRRNPDAELYGFASGVFRHTPRKGYSVLAEAQLFSNRIGEVGHGTEIAAAIRAVYRPSVRRMFIITDMQAFQDRGGYAGYGGSGTFRHGWSRGVTEAVRPETFLYGVSLGGYAGSMMPSGEGTRHELTGLTDATFRMIYAIEHDGTASWPWEERADAA